MKPVFQKIFDDKKGDCFAACLASLLEISLEDVPNFRELQTSGGPDMVTAADNWLREKYGKRLLGIEIYHPTGGERTDICLLNRLFHANQNEYLLLSGESPRKNADGSTKYHCVIGKADCWGYELVHDPHPEGGGLVGQPYGVKWILPVETNFEETQELLREAGVGCICPECKEGRLVKCGAGEWWCNKCEANRGDAVASYLPNLYATLIPKLRAVAKENGYALALHGSMMRDLDLLAAPWTDDAVEPQKLADALLEACQGYARPNVGHLPTVKPHGRLAWNIYVGGHAYIDLSVMPRVEVQNG